MIEAYLLHLLILICIYAILAMSLNLVTGYAGMLNLGHAALFAIGAYASALLALTGFPFWFCLLAAMALSAFFGLLLSIPALRLHGVFLAIATLGFGEIVRSFLLNWVELTRGPLGLPDIPKPVLFGIEFSEMHLFFVLAAAIAVISYFILRFLLNSAFGVTLKAIREDTTLAATLGKNVNKFKVLAFSVSALFAGIAGSLFAHYITFIDPSSFTLAETIMILLMIVLGGLGSLKGSIVGAIVLVLLPEPLRFIKVPGMLLGDFTAPLLLVPLPSAVIGQLRQIIYAVLLIILMIKKPNGLLGEQWFGGIASEG